MAVELAPIAAPEASTSTSTLVPEPARSFDERWAAWQAKGAAHDRAVRRQLAIAAPSLIIVAAVIIYAIYALLGR